MRKSRYLTIRASTQDVERLDRLAAAAGVNRSALLLSVINRLELKPVTRLEPYLEPEKFGLTAKDGASGLQPAGAGPQ